MAQTPPPTLTAPPDAPSRADPANFAARGDAFLGWFATAWSNLVATLANVYGNAVDAYNNALAAAASALSAYGSAQTSASNALASAASAGATAWVSGTTYAIGDVRWSPADGRIYRRRTAGAGTTDPSADATNWRLAAGAWWSLPTTLTVANNGATLAVNTTYHLDSSGGAFSLLMPVMSTNDWIKLVDVALQLGANNVTLTRNAANGNLAGYAEDRILVTPGDSVELVKTASYGVIEQ